MRFANSKDVKKKIVFKLYVLDYYAFPMEAIRDVIEHEIS